MSGLWAVPRSIRQSNLGGGSFYGGNDSVVVVCPSGTGCSFFGRRNDIRTGRGASGGSAGCARRGRGGYRRGQARRAQRVDAHLVGAGAVHDGAGPGDVLRRPGPQEERAGRDDAVRVPDGPDDGASGRCTATRWRSAATTNAQDQPVHRQQRLPVHERRRSGVGTTRAEAGRSTPMVRRRFRGSRTCCFRACSSSSRRR